MGYSEIQKCLKNGNIFMHLRTLDMTDMIEVLPSIKVVIIIIMKKRTIVSYCNNISFSVNDCLNSAEHGHHKMLSLLPKIIW